MSADTGALMNSIMNCSQQDVTGLVRLTILLTCLCAIRLEGASFVETGSMGTGRFVGSATLLTNGQVLLAGGGGNPALENVASAELYDPATHSCNFVNPMSIARIAHSAVLLPNGKVLIAGGTHNDTNL